MSTEQCGVTFLVNSKDIDGHEHELPACRFSMTSEDAPATIHAINKERANAIRSFLDGKCIKCIREVSDTH